MEAVEDFEDESLDFVYVDANFDSRYFAEDISEWTKKVRRGGIVSGRGYGSANQDVTYALKAYTKAGSIPSWYLIGAEVSSQKTKKDRGRTWMFFKPS